MSTTKRSASSLRPGAARGALLGRRVSCPCRPLARVRGGSSAGLGPPASGAGGRFRVSAQTSARSARCVTFRKCEPRRRGRRRGAAGSPGALTEITSPEFPAATGCPRVAWGRRSRSPAGPSRSPEKRVAAASAQDPRTAAAHFPPRPRREARLSGPGFGALGTRRPGRALARSLGGREGRSWHCGSLPDAFPPPDARPTISLHNSCSGTAA